MSKENKELVRYAIEEIFNRKKVHLIPSVYAPDCTGNSPDGPIQGRNGFQSFFEKYAAAFPDGYLHYECMIAEADRVVVPYVFHGTNRGALAGFPATGCTVEIPGVIINRIVNDWIYEQSFVWDSLGPRRRVRQAIAVERRIYKSDSELTGAHASMIG